MRKTDLILVGVGYLVVSDLVAEIQYRRDRSRWKREFEHWQAAGSPVELLHG